MKLSTHFLKSNKENLAALEEKFRVKCSHQFKSKEGFEQQPASEYLCDYKHLDILIYVYLIM